MKKILSVTFLIALCLVTTLSSIGIAATLPDDVVVFQRVPEQTKVCTYSVAIKDIRDNRTVAAFAVVGDKTDIDANLDALPIQTAHNVMNIVPFAVACDGSTSEQHNYKVTSLLTMFHVPQGNGTCKYWEQRHLECSYCHDMKIEGTKRNQKTHSTRSATCNNTFPYI